jgi:hypothetical protein
MLRWLFAVLFLFVVQTASSQVIIDSSGNRIRTDSLKNRMQPVHDKKIDSALRVPSPRKAIIRSAIIPGWGQIYNKKYWKLPLVYGALGISGGVFYFNLKNYRNTRFAYKVKYNIRLNRDSTGYDKIDPQLKPLSEESLRFYRDDFRRNVDYSALLFIAFWGLNIVDAAVDAHLKSFDVGPDLSLQIKPGYSEMAGTKGISLVLAFK